MKILILGQTAFLGRAIVSEAVNQNHELTVLNRTHLDQSLFPTVEWLTGSVPHDLRKVAGRKFDAVIDLSPALGADSLQTALSLAGRVGHYLTVSSISVYRDFATPHLDETYPCATFTENTPESATDFSTYGPRLARCEARIDEALPNQTAIVRAGLLTGPSDPTDRIPRLLRRAASGGDWLVGSAPSQPVQILDTRDLANFILHLLSNHQRGIFNAVGNPTTLGNTIHAAINATGSISSPIYLPEEYLGSQGILPLNHLPLWIPQRGYPGFFSVSNAHAISAGLSLRPLAQTLSDAWQSLESSPCLSLAPNAFPSLATLPNLAEQKIIANYTRATPREHSALLSA